MDNQISSRYESVASQREQTDTRCLRLFVGGLSSQTTEKDLQKLFERYGEISEGEVCRTTAGKSKKYGYLLYANEGDAHAVLRNSKDISMHSKILTVEPAVDLDQRILSHEYTCAHKLFVRDVPSRSE